MHFSILFACVLAADQHPHPRFVKYFTIVLENTDFSVAMETPFFKELATKGRLLTNMHGMVHPSQPNYLDMIAGTNFGHLTDDNVEAVGPTLPDLLEAKGMTWKAYMENYPGNCNSTYGTDDHLYMRKHNPFMSFASIREKQCENIVDEIQFEADVAAGSLPNYIFYTPNQIHDGHGIPPYSKSEHERIYEGSVWLSSFLPALLANPVFKDTLFVVTFDENDVTGDAESKAEGSDKPDSAIRIENTIYTVLLGAGVQAGSVDNNRYDHHSGIALLEQEWGLGSLGTGDVSAIPFKLADSDSDSDSDSYKPIYNSHTVATYGARATVSTTVCTTSTPPAAYYASTPTVTQAAAYTYAVYQSSALQSLSGCAFLIVGLALL